MLLFPLQFYSKQLRRGGLLGFLLSCDPVFLAFYHTFLQYLDLFMIVLGLCFRASAFASCNVWASHRSGVSCWGAWSLGAWASIVAELGLRGCSLQTLELRLSSCNVPAWLLCGMWTLPGLGFLSPAWKSPILPSKGGIQKKYILNRTESFDNEKGLRLLL